MTRTCCSLTLACRTKMRAMARIKKVPLVVSSVMLLAVAAGRVSGVPKPIPAPIKVQYHQATKKWEVNQGGRVYWLAVSPDGRLGASALDNGRVLRWSTQTRQSAAGKALLGLGGPVYNVAFSPNGETLAACSKSGVRIWSQSSAPQDLPSSAHGYAGAAAFSPDGQTLAVGYEDNTIELWDWTQKKSSRSLTPPSRSPVLGLAYDPTSHGARLASCSADGYVDFWEPDQPNPHLWRLSAFKTGGKRGVNWVAFSQDGKFLAAACADGVVRVLANPGTTKPTEWTEQLGTSPYSLLAVDFNKDDKLAAAYKDGRVVFWAPDAAGAQWRLRAFRPHDKPVEAVALRGTDLYTACVNGQVARWEVTDLLKQPVQDLVVQTHGPEGGSLEGVKVEVSGDGQSETLITQLTDKTGQSEFHSLPLGSYTVKLSKGGYQGHTERVEVDGAKPVRREVSMAAIPTQQPQGATERSAPQPQGPGPDHKPAAPSAQPTKLQPAVMSDRGTGSQLQSKMTPAAAAAEDALASLLQRDFPKAIQRAAEARGLDKANPLANGVLAAAVMLQVGPTAPSIPGEDDLVSAAGEATKGEQGAIAELARGLLDQANGHLNRAEEQIKSALLLDPNLTLADTSLYALYLRQRRGDQAAKARQAAIQITPDVTSYLDELKHDIDPKAQ